MADHPLYTFGFDRIARWPWAGALALFFLFMLSEVVLGNAAVWAKLSQRLSFLDAANRVVAREQIWLNQAEGDGRFTAVLLGTSRSMAGFSEPDIEDSVSGLNLVKLARPGQLPFHLRAIMADLAEAKPDVVILSLSEFDTHRPIRLEPVAGRGTANLTSLKDLVEVAGFGFAWANRTTVLRLAVASTLKAYQFRELLSNAGLDQLHRFSRKKGATRPRSSFRPGSEPIALWDGSVRAVTEDRIAGIASRFGGILGATVRPLQIPMVLEISGGTHVATQYELIRRGVEGLRRSGVEVLIVETPLHEASWELYDRRSRDEFVEFALGLAEIPGVEFVALEESGTFGPEDFDDILHLAAQGQEKLSAAVVPLLRDKLSAARDD